MCLREPNLIRAVQEVLELLNFCLFELSLIRYINQCDFVRWDIQSLVVFEAIRM